MASADCLKRYDRKDRKDRRKEPISKAITSDLLHSIVDETLRWVNNAMSFAMSYVIFAVFVVILRCADDSGEVFVAFSKNDPARFR